MITTTTKRLRWAYIGNFRPEHSTETHVAAALERIGQTVTRWQEDTAAPWDGTLEAALRAGDVDVVLWTRTGWEWPHTATGWSYEEAHDRQRALLAAAKDAEVATVGYHLDRWWGLNREGQVRDEPFFGVDLLCTADGGHDAEWEAAGVNHRWFPPAVLLSETERVPAPGLPAALTPRQSRADIVWVGSWRSYHAEWETYRHQLINQLRRTYRGRVAILPTPGQSIRGADLTDLYGHAKVVVGDSCLAGGATHYWSDRVPETIGRGGMLIHPNVPGLRDAYPSEAVPGLSLYELGDWPDLHHAIETFLSYGDDRRAEVSAAGRRHVQIHHTYERRMEQLVDVLMGSGALR